MGSTKIPFCQAKSRGTKCLTENKRRCRVTRVVGVADGKDPFSTRSGVIKEKKNVPILFRGGWFAKVMRKKVRW